MRKNDAADNLYKSFVSNDFVGVLEQYEYFKRDAICDKQIYVDFVAKLRKSQKAWKADSEKNILFNILQQMINIMCIGKLNEKTNRQKLIDILGEQTESVYNYFSKFPQYNNDVTIKYFAIHIIVDIFFAFSNNVQKIQLSAMFYDLMCKWNDSGTAEFYSFYGEEAKNEIIEYAYGNVLVFSELCNEKPDEWLEDVLADSDKEYVRRFCEKLCKKCVVEAAELKQVSEMPQKNAAQDMREVQNIRSVQSISDIQEHSEKNAETCVENDSIEKNKKFFLENIPTSIKVFYGILLAVIVGAALWWGVKYYIAFEENKDLKEKYVKLHDQYEELEYLYDKLNDDRKENEGIETPKDSDETVITELKPNVTDDTSESLTASEENVQQLTETETYSSKYNQNIHSEPIFGDNIIGSLPEGTEATVLIPVNGEGWIYIQYEELVGYVYIDVAN